MTSLGFGYPRTSFFFYPGDIFADFFKFIINQNNLSQHFTVPQGDKVYPYITPHLNFSYYYQTNFPSGGTDGMKRSTATGIATINRREYRGP